MASEELQIQLKQRFIEQRGIWNSEWEALLKLSPNYFEGYLNIQAASQGKNSLSPKVQELICVAVAASCTHIHIPAVRAHITSALALGATSDEILEVMGLTYLLGVHTVTLGAPILFELMDELGISQVPYEIDEARLHIKDKFISQRGFWPEGFTPLLQMDPGFFEAYTDFSSFSSRSKVLEPKIREIIICAFDAATTHLYARGTKVHMRNALKLGATPDEIIQMLEITSLMGIHGVSHSAPVLLQQLSARPEHLG